MSTRQRVGVVGAGLVGVVTAWHLQRRGLEVTVYDRGGIASGASWGNAGWLTPSMATPLPSPSVLRYGIRAALNPTSPVFVPPTLNLRTLRFLVEFARNSTSKRWSKAMASLVGINLKALDAYDVLADAGIALSPEPSSYMGAFGVERDRELFVGELEQAQALGQAIDLRLLTGAEALQLEPVLSDRVRYGLEVRGERFVNPAELTASLATALVGGGGRVVPDARVRNVASRDGAVALDVDGRERETFDAVVLAAGAWIEELARPLGVRTAIHGGRGYSFSATAEAHPQRPIYFPKERVVCTPLGDRVRVSGMMEIQRPDAPMSRRRLGAMVDSVRPLMSGLAVDDRVDEWVGSRPCSSDGLPLVGATAVPGIYMNGGHGMWGITHGPVTAALLADQIAAGKRPDALTPFDPLR